MIKVVSFMDIIKKKHDECITRDKSLYIKAVAIILMLVHHLFTFPERLPEGGYISLFSSIVLYVSIKKLTPYKYRISNKINRLIKLLKSLIIRLKYFNQDVIFM